MEDREKELLGMSDQEFREAMEISRPTVLMVAEWFRTKGYTIKIPETRVRPNYEEREKYSDNGDFFIVLPDRELRVEVKQLSHQFDSKETLFENTIVNAKHRWDNANPKPYMHVLVNRGKTHFAVIRSKTSESWFPCREWDRRKNGWRWFYKCPRELFEIREF